MPQLFHHAEPTRLLLQTHTGPTELNLLNTVISQRQNSVLSTVTRSLEPGRTSWTLSPPSNLHFHILGKKTSKTTTCKTMKYIRKSHPLLEFVASKASAKLPGQPCHIPLPCKLPDHQLLSYAWHGPLVKQNNGNTDFLLSIHLQGGCSKPSWFPWELRIV